MGKIRNRFNQEELKAKLYLSSLKWYRNAVKIKKMKLEEIEGLALPKGVSYDTIRVQGMSSMNPTEDRFIMASEAYDEYIKALNRFNEAEKDISKLIERVTERDADCGSVLEIIYICGASHEKAMEKLSVSESTFYRRYRKAHGLAWEAMDGK